MAERFAMARAMLMVRHDKEHEMSYKKLETIVYPLSSLGLIESNGQGHDEISDRYCTVSDRPAAEPGDTERKAYWCREQFC
jgi:hypothetical protein